ncbi:efflux RND transporter permease subunit [Aureibacter tunicatorum]|uniref:HAE1 family hydrophobic/amphiphilic exporter-1 n=1 Tax=Aureibacter tunicatorum TaxID=866807 RepID=A0AAE4BT92_9BACT|nr:efflux RND transporter permease subunit [Aureibacter tunicatorum]MDR6240551.1 HAE1 family hydrophobic/amphiphilic exporter-1 [Aureibacter tunicatorum]BDD06588.1 multidrug efflux RND transporter permease subunit [Aureibacter tunicatorum]
MADNENVQIDKVHFFSQRPILAFVIAILMVVLGVISMFTLTIDQYPDLTPPVVEVGATYIGASAVSIENSVANPIEQQINGVEDMLYLMSTNSSDGTVKIQVTFKVGSNPDLNTILTQNRVATATPRVPDPVKLYGITTRKSQPNILMLVSLTSDDDRFNQEFLTNYAKINIVDELSRIEGIGDIKVFGSGEYSMRVWLKPDLMAKLGITVPDVSNALQTQNVISPGGKFGAEPSYSDIEFTYTVRLPERLKTEEEFGEIIVKVDSSGSLVQIKDIADVELGVETYSSNSQYNGKQCGVIAIYQRPGSNALDIKNQVYNALEMLSKKFPEGIVYSYSLDSTTPITAAIKEIIETLGVVVFLVILVVFIFLQNWRATLIPAITIPVSLIGTFIFFPLLGFSINTLTLLGLVLAIGIVVDDTIVVVEAVRRNLESGMNIHIAVYEAMKMVTPPVIATTLVIIGVFVPVAFIGGISGRLYQQFAITIAASVSLSSVNALTLSPALCTMLLGNNDEKLSKTKFFVWFNKLFERQKNGYLALVEKLSVKPIRAFLATLLFVALNALLLDKVPRGFLPDEDQGYLFVNIQLPNAASLVRTSNVMKHVAEILRKDEDVDKITTVNGFSLLTGGTAPNTGFVFVTLTDWSKRSRTAKEIVETLNQKFRYGIVAAEVFAFGPPPIRGLGTNAGFSVMIQDLTDHSPQYLSEQVEKFIDELNNRKEITNAFTTFQSDVPQKYLSPDISKVLKFGVSLQDVYATIGAFLGGTYVNDFNRFGKVYKAYIQAKRDFRMDEEALEFYYVNGRNDTRVPISTLVNLKSISGPEYTNRFNLHRSAQVTGTSAPGFTSGQALKTIEEVAAEVLPEGMGYAWNGLSYQQKEAGSSEIYIFLLCLFFVFMILAGLYESWSMPLIILFGTPIALLGALGFLEVFRYIDTSYENNTFAQISFVLLIALAAKNAILIVEYAKVIYEEGKSLKEAAFSSSKLRFRPIVMTSVSFIFGVIPLVFATGAGAEARKVMGMALLGGMLLASIIGLLIYPVMFIYLGRVFKFKRKRLVK